MGRMVTRLLQLCVRSGTKGRSAAGAVASTSGFDQAATWTGTLSATIARATTSATQRGAGCHDESASKSTIRTTQTVGTGHRRSTRIGESGSTNEGSPATEYEETVMPLG